MTLQDFAICVTAVISIISLLLSFANYWNNKPKLKIKITNKKWDCFFGKVLREKDGFFSNIIGGAYINIVNNSPVSITVSNICLKINEESLRLIDCRNPYWSDIEFCFKDNNGNWSTDGTSIGYSQEGKVFPFKIKAYDSISCVVLFHAFPAKYKKECRGQLILNTAIGKVKKNISLIEYDENYEEEGYRDYLQHYRNSQAK